MTQRAGSGDPGDGSVLRRQAAAVARTLVRPRAYVGAAREVTLGAFHLATYPLGLLPGLTAPERRVDPPVSTDPATAKLPVILVHGYFHNRSAFLVMTRGLRRAGFRDVHTFTFRPLAGGLAETAQLLAEDVERVLDAVGAPRCQLVAHSMGGLVARYYVQQLGGTETVDTVITLGTPHRGTYASYLGVGRAAAELRPGSPFLHRLEQSARPSDVRWIAYYSDLDVTMVPAASAKLVHPALDATNIRLHDTGHLSLLLSGEVLRGVVTHLANRDIDRPSRTRQPR